jgi:hypothetical protein
MRPVEQQRLGDEPFPHRFVACAEFTVLFAGNIHPARSIVVMSPTGTNNMRWRLRPTGHDGRQIDLLAILALLVLIVAAWRYLDDSTALPPSTTAYIVPSQHVRW